MRRRSMTLTFIVMGAYFTGGTGRKGNRQREGAKEREKKMRTKAWGAERRARHRDERRKMNDERDS